MSTGDAKRPKALEKENERPRDSGRRRLVACVSKRSWTGGSVVDVRRDAFFEHGTQEYIRSDNGSEFAANKVRDQSASIEVQTIYIEPGSPWENGCCERFNSKMRDEFLNGGCSRLGARWRCPPGDGCP